MKDKVPARASGVALALAAAGMLAGCQSNPTSGGSASTASVEMGHCYGVNACGGHNDCKTAKNACAGHASCKGTGFVAMPTKACGDIGGTVRDDWRGKVAKADLSQCHGVNACAGHNDCKTAKNACASHASCKGTGFVLMPSKACKDVGGKLG
ncbi:MAG: hypothetical protein H6953_08630 [Chromatiaceae bacterium]|nr:hypothetical protein [Chromatiaceae bacterium]MCP5315459.1 hypothetical protein [Chromatiaceae bacterium]